MGVVVVAGVSSVVVVTGAGVEVSPELHESQAGTDSRDVGVHLNVSESHTIATGIQEPVVQVKVITVPAVRLEPSQSEVRSKCERGGMPP